MEKEWKVEFCHVMEIAMETGCTICKILSRSRTPGETDIGNFNLINSRFRCQIIYLTSFYFVSVQMTLFSMMES